MTTTEALTERVRAALGKSRELGDKSLKFDLGSGARILFDGASGQVSNEDRAATTTLAIASHDPSALLEGTLDPTLAYMQGKLKVQGDIGLAMKLQALLGAA